MSAGELCTKVHTFVTENASEIDFIVAPYLCSTGSSAQEFIDGLLNTDTVVNILQLYFLAVTHNLVFAVLTSSGVWSSELREMSQPDLIFVWQENGALEHAQCKEWFHPGVDMSHRHWDTTQVIQALLKMYDYMPPVCKETAEKIIVDYTPSDSELYHARENKVTRTKWSTTLQEVKTFTVEG